MRFSPVLLKIFNYVIIYTLPKEVGTEANKNEINR
jgi:hypothetical protein